MPRSISCQPHWPRRGLTPLSVVFAAICGMWMPPAFAAEPEISDADRAAIARPITDPHKADRVAPWWWEPASGHWTPAPEARWHDAVDRGDARMRWLNVVSIRHTTVRGQGRLAWVLDAGHRSHADPLIGGAKLVALCTLTGRAVDAWWFDPGHTLTAQSDLRNFAIDATGTLAIVQDAGAASLIVVNLSSRRSHRALIGRIPGDPTLTLDEDCGWLVWESSTKRMAWQVPLEELRDARFDADALAHLVEPTTLHQRDHARVGRLPANAAQRWLRVAVWSRLAGDADRLTLLTEAARGITERWRSTAALPRS